MSAVRKRQGRSPGTRLLMCLGRTRVSERVVCPQDRVRVHFRGREASVLLRVLRLQGRCPVFSLRPVRLLPRQSAARVFCSAGVTDAVRPVTLSARLKVFHVLLSTKSQHTRLQGLQFPNDLLGKA